MSISKNISRCNVCQLDYDIPTRIKNGLGLGSEANAIYVFEKMTIIVDEKAHTIVEVTYVPELKCISNDKKLTVTFVDGKKHGPIKFVDGKMVCEGNNQNGQHQGL